MSIKHLVVVDASGLCWLVEERSQDVFLQLILFAYVLMYVHSDMQVLPERRDCAVCPQLLPGSRLNLDRSRVRNHCRFLSIKPLFPIQNTETNIPFRANKNDTGDFCVMVWLHYLAITAFLPLTPMVPFGRLFFLISLYRQDLIASI